MIALMRSPDESRAAEAGGTKRHSAKNPARSADGQIGPNP
jgi:hypothetical protein